MSFRILTLSAAAAALLSAQSAYAGSTQNTITFDDLPSDANNSITQYAGFNWDNFFVVDPVASGSSGTGLANGVVSGSNIAYNGYGAPASFSAVNGVFNLVSLYATSDYVDGNVVTITGFLNGFVDYSTTFTTNTAGPAFQTLNWNGIDQVSFSTSSYQIALDNVTVSTSGPQPVPGPIAGAGLPALLGLLGLGLLYRRQWTVVV